MLLLLMILMMNKMHDDAVNYNDLSYHKQVALCRAGVKCEVRGGKMRGTGAR